MGSLFGWLAAIPASPPVPCCDESFSTGRPAADEGGSLAARQKCKTTQGARRQGPRHNLKTYPKLPMQSRAFFCSLGCIQSRCLSSRELSLSAESGLVELAMTFTPFPGFVVCIIGLH
jgi:hypothetical protein